MVPSKPPPRARLPFLVAGLALALLCATCVRDAQVERGSPLDPVAPPLEVVVAAPAPPPDPPPSAPFQLTSSEGVGLRVASVRARTALRDPIALTELHLVFENPEARRIEGRFTLALPPRASLGRFAMRIGGVLQEGEVVEKSAARLTYEEYLHVRRDPALLEQGAGNEVAVRVFPIEPHEHKEIVVTYSELLDATHPYRLRLAGLPAIGELDAVAYVNGAAVATATARDHAPSGDFLVPAAAWSSGASAALTGGADAAVRVRVGGTASPAPVTDAVVALVDTSASRALDLGKEAALVAELARTLAPATRLVVAAYDQEVELVFDGDASSFGEAEVARLRARRALGASDLGGALRHALAVPRRTPTETRRLVLFGDGVATAGDTDARVLGDLSKSLGRVGYLRADAVALGGLRDVDALRAIVRSALPKSGVVVGEEDGLDVVLRRLATDTSGPLPVRVGGAAFTSPAVVEGAIPGDDVVVLASFPGGRVPRSLEVSIGEETAHVAPGKAPAQLVGRALASAKIQALEQDTELPEPARRAKIIELATKHRVESAYTAMLVLENDEAYAQHHIDRKAKLDILSVVNGDIQLVAQARAPRASGSSDASPGTPAADPSASPPPVQAAPTPASTPTPSPGPRHVSRPPQIRMGATSVSGRLPPEVVQRIVRLSFGRFRGCYRAGLLANPTLQGRVVLEFLIGRDGSVQTAGDGGSTLPSRTVIQCMVRQTMGLTFPQPEGGVVRITYPILLTPDGVEDAPVAFESLRPRPRALVPSSTLGPTDPLAGRSDGPMYSGAFGDVMDAMETDAPAPALGLAWKLVQAEPTSVLSFVALGRAAEHAGDSRLAARAFGSILELWSYRVDMRRFAGEQLEHVGTPQAVALAGDAYRGAALDRPDHPSSHWLLAMNLLRRGEPAQAFKALERGLDRTYAFGRFAGSTELMRDDLAMIGAAWAKLVPDQREEIAAKLSRHERSIDTAAHVRVSLVWETDANDVDLYLTDVHGEHTWYGHRRNRRGGMLYADVTDGYGPEGFDGPVLGEPGESYRLRVHYYARGPMGFGMGKVTIVRHDGAGAVTFDDRPFVLTTPQAVVDLGKYDLSR